jgi:hypoxanthine phosphoribosyltransferase
VSKLGRVYLTEEALRSRLDELGAEIASQAPGDLLAITTLKGGVPFLADLVRRLPPTVVVDFLALAPFPGGEKPPGVARLMTDLVEPVSGRHVLVVEDVVDTGLSLAFLLRVLEEREPASISVCALLDREHKRIVDTPVAFRGFTLGDEYLVGYGLDFLGLYRNLPCLVAVDDIDGLRADPLALTPVLRALGVWAADREG